MSLKIEEILCVASGVAANRGAGSVTHVEMVLWKHQGLLELEWRFDHCGCKTGGQVPINVAVEEPDACSAAVSEMYECETQEGLTRVICLEPDHEVAIWSHHQCVSAHRARREIVMLALIVEAGVRWRSIHRLEGMAMQMERMLAGVVVVEDKFNDVVFLQDEWVGVPSIHSRIGGFIAGRQDGVEGWDYRCGVRDVVEERAT